jgi:RNA polymerase sigma-70 factor (ECF subfamily)
LPNDDLVVGSAAPVDDQGDVLLALYDRSLPQVYGYLVARCGRATLAEDLTADTYLAAVAAIHRGTVPNLSIAWLMTVARNKLVDHWRRQEREDRSLHLIANDSDDVVVDDEPLGPDCFDHDRTHEVLQRIGAHHRAALTLRYLDGLSVPEVARYLDRTVHATEALLVRARTAFRRSYNDHDGSGDGY